MSIVVENLSKVYGEQTAVDNLSFELKKGEILGFLGPNGAGKSSTMKMLTTFIPPTSGRAFVAGFDIEKEGDELRKRVGYLPQDNPLYLDMYVREYLLFIAGLHRLDRKKARVDQMIEQTGLSREAHKLIGSLSGGYRQRVGLAQALLHDPEVLILDEPTSGLDPNQLVEIRALVRQLGEEKTVLFSSHIMQEIEALCDRVLILNRGKLVADDRISNLQTKLGQEQRVKVLFKEKVSRQQLEQLGQVEPLGGGAFLLSSSQKNDLREELFRFAVDQKLSLLELVPERSSIEQVFQKLTS